MTPFSPSVLIFTPTVVAGCLIGAAFTILTWIYVPLLRNWAVVFAEKEKRRWGLILFTLVFLLGTYYGIVGKSPLVTLTWGAVAFVVCCIGSFAIRLAVYGVESWLKGMLDRERTHSAGHFGANAD